MAAPKPFYVENNTARCKAARRTPEAHSYRVHNVPAWRGRPSRRRGGAVVVNRIGIHLDNSARPLLRAWGERDLPSPVKLATCAQMFLHSAETHCVIRG